MAEADRIPEAELPKELIELRQRFVQRLPGHVDAITEMFSALSDARWEHSAGETLHRKVHSLTGTSGTFGLREVSAAARKLEHGLSAILRGEVRPAGAKWDELVGALADLQAQARAVEATAVAPSPATTPVPPSRGTLVHVVAHPQTPVERLHSALTLDGFRVQVFASAQAFHEAASQPDSEWPAAVLLDVADDSTGDAPALIQALGLAGHPAIPLLVALSARDLPARIAVARAGARRTLQQPVNTAQLIDALSELTGRGPARPWRVLLVDDDDEVMQVHAAHLRHAGMEVRTLQDPMQTLDLVEGFGPDVLLLDVYMPEVSGPELAAVLRECNARPHLAILFLSSETDMSQQLLALNLGGDDFLIKPVQPMHLVAAVTARARRARHNQMVQQHLETTVYEREREHLALNEHAIVSMADAQGNITYANDLFCAVSGYSREQVLGQNHRLIKSDRHGAEFYQTMWATIASGQVWKGEICNRRRNGSLFWVECTITPFMDAHGLPYRYVSIRTEITHIKEAEARLRKQRDMQRMISVAAARLMAAPAHLATESIQAALQASGELLGADNAMLFRVSKDGASMRNTHYWSANGSASGPEKLSVIPLDHFDWMRAWFTKEGIAVVPDVNLLPLEATAERSALNATGTSAMIASPMMKKGQIAGFVGYSAKHPMPHWTPEISELLNVLSEVIAGALARQRAELALRGSEARLSFLVSSSPVTIYTRSAEAPFELTYVSPNAKALIGWEPEAFTGEARFWAQQVHPDDRDMVESLTPLALDGRVHQHEYRLHNGDGGYRWVHDQVRLARDDSSGASELVGYWMDITERKKIEGELSRFNHELEQRVAEQTQSVIESERFARATLDALDARVVILDEQGCILAANRAWREFPMVKAEPVSASEGAEYLLYCDDLYGCEASGDRPIATGIQAVINGSLPDFLHEYACPHATTPRWFVCRVKRFPGDGAVRVVVSHEDITAMKLIERQQMRSQRLESLGTLAGGVAHDLNNSLAPILMGMGILQDQFPEEGKLIGMIHNSAKRGADMVRQLLAFAKGVDGKRVALRPAQLIEELESLMKGSFPKNIDLKVECDPALPMVVGDATQLHQILLNLCVNARDAMPHGGTLSLEGKVVEIDAVYARTASDAKPGRYVCLRVRDTGDGIAPDLLDRIFDPFFTTKSQDKGTGLGLSTVLGIVKGHGGFVNVYSTVGTGTTFAVYLPISQQATESAEAIEAAKPFRGQSENILFVDDEPALREVGETVLKRLNFTPIVAMDGEDALIKATENRATLKAIITDMHMPHMDGLAFVHAVRRTLPNIPIILASGRVDDSVAKDFKALGVTARLDKPFTEVQLAEKLRGVLAPAENKV